MSHETNTYLKTPAFRMFGSGDLIAKTWAITFDAIPGNGLKIPMPIQADIDTNEIYGFTMLGNLNNADLNTYYNNISNTILSPTEAADWCITLMGADGRLVMENAPVNMFNAAVLRQNNIIATRFKLDSSACYLTRRGAAVPATPFAIVFIYFIKNPDIKN